jgi:hypothetical protein
MRLLLERLAAQASWGQLQLNVPGAQLVAAPALDESVESTPASNLAKKNIH